MLQLWCLRCNREKCSEAGDAMRWSSTAMAELCPISGGQPLEGRLSRLNRGDGPVEVSPELHGGREGHVPRHPHPLPEVRQALDKLLAVSTALHVIGQHVLASGLQGVASKQRRCHVPQHHIHLRCPVHVGLGIRVGEGRGELLGTRATRPPAAESHDSIEVPQQLAGCLLPGRLIALVHVGRQGLQGSGGPQLQRQLPAALLPTNGTGCGLDLLTVVCVARAVLRRNVPHMREVVALGGLVRGPLLKGVNPLLQARPPLGAPQLHALPVQAGCQHALYMADVLEVNDAGYIAAQEPWGLGVIGQSSLHPVHRLLKRGLRAVAANCEAPETEAAAGPEHQRTPVAKQLPLEAQELVGLLELRAARVWAHLWAVKVGLQELHDHQGLCDQLPIHLNGWEQPTGHLLQELLRLVSVAPHVDLVDPVGDLLLFQLQPDLLAVRAPGCSVSVQCHPHLLLLLAKQAQLAVRVGRALALGPQLLQLLQALPDRRGIGLLNQILLGRGAVLRDHTHGERRHAALSGHTTPCLREGGPHTQGTSLAGLKAAGPESTLWRDVARNSCG
mmetsp:Transcript_11410/g.32377  ORF Transcript_11410/g.32377 Transcript_11410/m.32377 type:complete len:560 (-) Transcript_11410:207-1886(-)